MWSNINVCGQHKLTLLDVTSCFLYVFQICQTFQSLWHYLHFPGYLSAFQSVIQPFQSNTPFTHLETVKIHLKINLHFIWLMKAFKHGEEIWRKINIVECEVWEIKWLADGGNPWGEPSSGRSYLRTHSHLFVVFK